MRKDWKGKADEHSISSDLRTYKLEFGKRRYEDVVARMMGECILREETTRL
jgi:hypothetical protein